MSKLTIGFLLLLRVAASQTTPMTAPADVVSGTVVNVLTNAPLAKVLVTVTPVMQTVRPGEKVPSRFAVTGADGRFGFLNIPPGKYQLSAARPHDRPQLYLSDGDQYSTAIVTGAGVDTTQLVFPYHPGGAIRGTVVDESGEPIRQAQVHLFHHAMIDGRVQYSMGNSTMTRADGSFHFGFLTAGTYFVGVFARPWFAAQDARVPGQIKPEFDVAFPFTYYPAATDFSGASPVSVTEGSSSSIQISMRAVPAVHAPLLRSSDNNNEFRNIQFMSVGPGGLPIMNMGNLLQTPEGASVTLAPGRYQVLEIDRKGNRQFPSASRSVEITGDAPIDAGTPSKINVTGNIAIEAAEKPTNKIFVSLVSPQRGWMGAVQAEAAADGSFSFNDRPLQPGRYRLQLPNNPAFFLKSITAKGAALSDGELDLAVDSAVQLSLVLAPYRESALEGVAVRNGQPVAGAMVLLLPVAPGQGQLTRRDQSDLDGSFALRGVAPGTYRLLAIDNGHNFAYRDAEALKSYLAGAKPITIGNGPLPSGIKVEVQHRQQ